MHLCCCWELRSTPGYTPMHVPPHSNLLKAPHDLYRLLLLNSLTGSNSPTLICLNQIPIPVEAIHHHPLISRRSVPNLQCCFKWYTCNIFIVRILLRTILQPYLEPCKYLFLLGYYCQFPAAAAKRGFPSNAVSIDAVFAGSIRYPNSDWLEKSM